MSSPIVPLKFALALPSQAPNMNVFGTHAPWERSCYTISCPNVWAPELSPFALKWISSVVEPLWPSAMPSPNPNMIIFRSRAFFRASIRHENYWQSQKIWCSNDKRFGGQQSIPGGGWDLEGGELSGWGRLWRLSVGSRMDGLAA